MIEWRPIAGWDFYEISDHGRVRRVTATSRRLRRLNIVSGYSVCILQQGSKRKLITVHKVMLETFVGPASAGQESRHRDGVRMHNTLDNLVWGTKLENAADRVIHGTQCRGETHGRAKLTETAVREIRADYAAGITQAQLAAAHGVNQTKISNIVRRRSWAHVA